MNTHELYANAAVLAAQQCADQPGLNPVKAWQHQVGIAFEKKSMRDKGCPKSTFLTLCQEGLINGILQKKYTRARENREYTLKAVKLLNENPKLSKDPMFLWDLAKDAKVNEYNHQMHIIATLWNKGYIIRKS